MWQLYSTHVSLCVLHTAIVPVGTLLGRRPRVAPLLHVSVVAINSSSRSSVGLEAGRLFAHDKYYFGWRHAIALLKHCLLSTARKWPWLDDAIVNNTPLALSLSRKPELAHNSGANENIDHAVSAQAERSSRRIANHDNNVILSQADKTSFSGKKKHRSETLLNVLHSSEYECRSADDAIVQTRGVCQKYIYISRRHTYKPDN